MAIRKNDLDSSLYQLCDALRGGMDPSQYKDYVLTLVFVKYISDKFQGDRYASIVIPEGCSFEDFKLLRNQVDIGDKIDKALQKLAAANSEMLGGMFKDVHFDDDAKIGKGKEKVDKLTKLIDIFCRPEFDFSRNRAEGDDILGDVYENLMKHFAVDSGKSKGQFYTPAEASRVLAGVLGISDIALKEDENENWTICDAACGSGSLLIRAANEVPDGVPLSIYGQEKDITTAGLCRMNMVLHGLETAIIRDGNTFSDPQFKHEEDGKEVLDTFDFIVMNPPFSVKNWTDGYKDFGRTEGYGAKPPEKNGDFAWLMHVLKSLKPTGRAAVIFPLGVLFKGNAEGLIRKAVVDKGWLEGIIAFPPNIFYGVGIPACVLILTKASAALRGGVFMIDASRDFVKDGPKNRLRERDIEKIVATYRTRREIPHYSRFVQWGEIKVKNGYNLNVPRYIDSGIREDTQDVVAHLQGGIPSVDLDGLAAYWSAFPGLREKLFAPFSDGYEKLAIDPATIREAVRGDASFAAYAFKVVKAFNDWSETFAAAGRSISAETKAKAFVREQAKALFCAFEAIDGKLIDPYDAYEVLLKYWTDSMCDDVHALVADGFAAGREVEVFYKESKSKKTGQTTKKATGWEGALISRALLDARFFAAETKAVREAEAALEAAKAAFDEYVEEQVQEDLGEGAHGCLFEYQTKADDGESKDDKIKLEKKRLKSDYARLKREKPKDAETCALARYYELEKSVSDAKNAATAAAKALETCEKAKYPALTEDELKALIVDDKWLAAIKNGIDELYTSVSNRLSERVAMIAERYAASLPQLDEEGEALEAEVAADLKALGYVGE